jgi:uncharacterized membrane protein YhdT
MNKAEGRAGRRARMIKRGRVSFTLRYGVIGWGISTALVFALYQGFFQGWESFPRWLGLSLMIFPIGGWFWGVMMWRFVIRADQTEQGR